PFNQGKLCPKGIKRYLQNNHRDRLLRPLVRTGRGFAPIPWDEALDQVAERIRRIQDRHGRDAVAVLSGASLTNEKAYLMGKFARLAVGTRHIDYNGRLCFVAAHTSGFDAVIAAVRGYAPEAVEHEVGIPARRIREAAALWVQAPRTMLLHARGIEHHTKGVDNVLACINLVLATGKIGRAG